MVRDDGRVRRISANVFWHFGEIGIRTGATFLLFLFAARTLGPADYGFLMTVVAAARLLKAPASLGLNSIAVREIVVHRDSRRRITENVFLLRAFAGLVGSGCVVAFMSIYRSLTVGEGLVVLFVSTTVIFQARQAFESYLQARERFSVLFGIHAASVAAAFGVLALVVSSGGIDARGFAGVYGLIWGIPLIVLVGLWVATGDWEARIGGDWDLRRMLLSKSWPLILSSAAAMMYVKADLIIVNYFLGDEGSGYYASVIQLVSAVALMAMVVARVCFPEFVRRRDEEGTGQALAFFRLIGWGLLAVGGVGAVVTNGFADPILAWVFGPEYTEATAALKVYALVIPVMFFGEWVSKMLVVEELYTLSLTRHVYAGLVNVGLNIWLVPIYGAVAAAVATVASYVTAVVVVPCIDSRARAYLTVMLNFQKA